MFSIELNGYLMDLLLFYFFENRNLLIHNILKGTKSKPLQYVIIITLFIIAIIKCEWHVSKCSKVST